MDSISPVRLTVDAGVDISTPPVSAGKPASEPVRDTSPPQTQFQLSELGLLQSTLSRFLDATHHLSQSENWRRTQATSSDPATLTALSTGAAAQYLRITVASLASAQTAVSAPISNEGATPIGAGAIHIEIGTWNTERSAFTSNPNWPKSSIVVGPNDASLEAVRDKINAAGMGVVATIISDATGSRLMLTSTSTGADFGFKVSAENDTSEAPLGLRVTQTARDAQISVNGKTVTSSSNVIDHAADGLSLTVKRTSDEPVTIRVSSDIEGIKQSVLNFAQSFNDLSAQLSHTNSASTSKVKQFGQTIQDMVTKHWNDAQGNDSSLTDQLMALGLRQNNQGLLKVDEARMIQTLTRGQPGMAQLSNLAKNVFDQMSVTTRSEAVTPNTLRTPYSFENDA
ncbi:MAG: flagellar filament capping protein FliD [Burkholderiales bacterium]|nr:flagellar filament capping protein FliD [Burkholderiales bacterium]